MLAAPWKISGKILTATDGDPFDSTRQMGLWSMVPAEDSNCYRKVTVEIIQAGIVERKYYFPNAFVVNYNEDFGDTDGVGTFKLTIKQKKDNCPISPSKAVMRQPPNPI